MKTNMSSSAHFLCLMPPPQGNSRATGSRSETEGCVETERQPLQFICVGVLKSSGLIQMFPVGFGAVPQKLRVGWVDVWGGMWSEMFDGWRGRSSSKGRCAKWTGIWFKWWTVACQIYSSQIVNRLKIVRDWMPSVLIFNCLFPYVKHLARARMQFANLWSLQHISQNLQN